MAEFTGERIIPGHVDADLWNEHAARYRFALGYASGKRVLDAGCGTGYGAQCLAARAASVTALDISPDALAWAAANQGAPNLRFVQASCESLPFAPASFDLIVSFEVIEHLADWRACLEQFRQVLAREGTLVISTPNSGYYAEARAESGPNPFHVHEFDYDEFDAALREYFPHIRLLTENHSDGVVFLPAGDPPRETEAALALDKADGDPAGANFFVAICRFEPGPAPRTFVFLPSAANVLRERERHIAMLAGDLKSLREEKQHLVELFREQEAELKKSNRWAEELDSALAGARARIAALQGELAAEQSASAAHVSRLEHELADARSTASGHIERLEQEKASAAEGYEAQIARMKQDIADIHAGYQKRAAELEARLEAKSEELANCVALLDKAEATVVERTEWAQRLDHENQDLRAQLETVKASRWVRLGNSIGVGPLPGER